MRTMRWSLSVAELVIASQGRAGVFLHDASEAYFVHVPGPIKLYLPGHKEAEEGLLHVIFERFRSAVTGH
jgi:hypothetical protein